jgi:hypothetical protein
MNTKVVDLGTSYNFYKGCIGFLPRFESILMPTLNVSLFLVTVKAVLQGFFHNFPLQI